MAVPFIQGEDFALFAPEDEEAKSALSSDPEVMGMQIAMLQPSAPRQLIEEASKCFQRSWFEAVVVERASDQRCGWPPCDAGLQNSRTLGSSKARQRLAEKKLSGDDRETYCSGACREVALRFASTLPFRRSSVPSGTVDPFSSAARARAAEEARLDALRGSKRIKPIRRKKQSKPGVHARKKLDSPQKSIARTDPQATNLASGAGSLDQSYSKWDGILKSISEDDISERAETASSGENPTLDGNSGTVQIQSILESPQTEPMQPAATTVDSGFELHHASTPRDLPPQMLKAAEAAAAAAIRGSLPPARKQGGQSKAAASSLIHKTLAQELEEARKASGALAGGEASGATGPALDQKKRTSRFKAKAAARTGANSAGSAAAPNATTTLKASLGGSNPAGAVSALAAATTPSATPALGYGPVKLNVVERSDAQAAAGPRLMPMRAGRPYPSAAPTPPPTTTTEEEARRSASQSVAQAAGGGEVEEEKKERGEGAQPFGDVNASSSIEGYAPRLQHSPAPFASLASVLRRPFDPPPPREQEDSIESVGPAACTTACRCGSSSAEDSASLKTCLACTPPSPLPPAPPPATAPGTTTIAATKDTAALNGSDMAVGALGGDGGGGVGGSGMVVADLSFHVMSAAELEKVIEGKDGDHPGKPGGAKKVKESAPGSSDPSLSEATTMAATMTGTMSSRETGEKKSSLGNSTGVNDSCQGTGALNTASASSARQQLPGGTNKSDLEESDDFARKQGYRAEGSDPVGAAAVWGGQGDGGGEDYSDEEGDDFDEDEFEEDDGGGDDDGWRVTPFMEALDSLVGWRTPESDAFALRLHMGRRCERRPELHHRAAAAAVPPPPPPPPTPSPPSPAWSHPSVTGRRAALRGVLQREEAWLGGALFGGGGGQEVASVLEEALKSAEELVSLFLPTDPLPHSASLTSPKIEMTDSPSKEDETTPPASNAASTALWRLLALVLVVVAWPPAKPLPTILTHENAEASRVRVQAKLPSSISKELGVDSQEFSALCSSCLDAH